MCLIEELLGLTKFIIFRSGKRDDRLSRLCGILDRVLEIFSVIREGKILNMILGW